MPLVRVFASFDLERDQKLLDRLIDESKKRGSTFVVCDRSMKDAATEDAAELLVDRIARVDAVVVLCGAWTHRAPNVTAELKVAQEMKKRYYFLKGYRFRDCARPDNAHVDDKLYIWGRGTVQELVLRFR